jgi:hypothetical protein
MIVNAHGISFKTKTIIEWQHLGEITNKERKMAMNQNEALRDPKPIQPPIII